MFTGLFLNKTCNKKIFLKIFDIHIKNVNIRLSKNKKRKQFMKKNFFKTTATLYRTRSFAINNKNEGGRYANKYVKQVSKSY